MSYTQTTIETNNDLLLLGSRLLCQLYNSNLPCLQTHTTSFVCRLASLQFWHKLADTSWLKTRRFSRNTTWLQLDLANSLPTASKVDKQTNKCDKRQRTTGRYSKLGIIFVCHVTTKVTYLWYFRYAPNNHTRWTTTTTLQIDALFCKQVRVVNYKHRFWQSATILANVLPTVSVVVCGVCYWSWI